MRLEIGRWNLGNSEEAEKCFLIPNFQLLLTEVAR